MNEDELDGQAVRLVAAWNTQESDVDQLLETLKKIWLEFCYKNSMYLITLSNFLWVIPL